MRGAALAPSAVTKSLICVDYVENGEWFGRLVNPYMREIMSFKGVKEMLDILENFFNEVAFPQPYYQLRDFSDKKRSDPQELDEETDGKTLELYQDEKILEQERGNVATFTLQVLFRHHASWQGMLVWNERTRTTSFRSTLEMLRLIHEALRQVDNNEQVASWEN